MELSCGDNEFALFYWSSSFFHVFQPFASFYGESQEQRIHQKPLALRLVRI